MVSRVGKGVFVCLLLGFLCSCNCGSKNQDNRGVPVLIFHDVAYESLDVLNTAPDYFRDLAQMIHLAGKQTWFAGDLVNCLAENHPLPQKSIVITFDDAWTAMRDTVDPLLKAKDMKATFFVHLSGIEAGRPVRCGWEDLHYLRDSGRWEIHSHSLTHKNLTCLSRKELRQELEESRKRLYGNGFTNANLIAYPFGAYTRKVKDYTVQAGYRGAFTAGPIPSATSGSDIYAIPRTTGCQVFDQALMCKKMDIDLATIREHLAIFDEKEGTFTGEWECVHYAEKESSECTTLGQMGKTYACTSESAAAWEIEFLIAKKGMYEFSVWKPLRYKNTFIEEYTINWKIFGGKESQNGKTAVRESNRWNGLVALPLTKGMYTLHILPKKQSKRIFVDAVKMERIE